MVEPPQALNIHRQNCAPPVLVVPVPMPVVCMVAPTVGVKAAPRLKAQQRHVEMTPLRCHRQARHQRLPRPLLPRHMLVLVFVLVCMWMWMRALVGQA